MNKKSQIYLRLTTLLESGISLKKALHIIHSSESSNIAKGFGRMIDVLDQGADMEQAIDASHIFSPLEVKLLLAGNKVGSIDNAFRQISEYHEQRAKFKQILTNKLAYPAFLLHAGIFIPNITLLMKSGLETYLTTVLTALFFLYFFIAAPFLLYFFLKRIPTLSLLTDQIVLKLPWIGKMIQKREIWRTLTVFGALYRAGIPTIECMKDTCYITPLLPLKHAYKRICQRLTHHETLADAFQKESIFPATVQDFIATGEHSGQLDETVKHACVVMDQESLTSMQRFMNVVPVIIFLAIATWIGYTVISFYANYFGRISRF